MRYELRYNNGVIHIFDTVRYTAVDAYQKHQQEQALQRVARMDGL